VFDVDPWTFLTIVALGVVTVVTRGFFFLSNRPWTLAGGGAGGGK
jgi:hypothetical protein